MDSKLMARKGVVASALAVTAAVAVSCAHAKEAGNAASSAVSAGASVASSAASGASSVVSSVVAGSPTTTNGSSASSGSPSAAQLTVDGQAQPVQGAVTCTPTGAGIGGNGVIIAVGKASPTDDNPPISVEMLDASNVGSVSLNVNGMHLLHDKGGYDKGSASATKDGNTYTITGNIPGNGPNGEAVPLKPYELVVTCP